MLYRPGVAAGRSTVFSHEAELTVSESIGARIVLTIEIASCTLAISNPAEAMLYPILNFSAPVFSSLWASPYQCGTQEDEQENDLCSHLLPRDRRSIA